MHPWAIPKAFLRSNKRVLCDLHTLSSSISVMSASISICTLNATNKVNMMHGILMLESRSKSCINIRLVRESSSR